MEDLIIFFAGIFFYFLLDLLKAYLKKKIENKVLIKDLPVITNVTEAVKQEFRAELANINAQLTQLNNKRSFIDEKSIQVLNQFFERCLELDELHSQNFGDFIGKDLAQVLVKYQLRVETTHRKLYSDYHNLALFYFKNKEIMKNANDIISSSHLVKTTFKKHFAKIKLALLSEANSIGNSSFNELTEKTNHIVKDYYSDRKSNYDLFNSNYNSLLESLAKYFSEFGLIFRHEELNE